MEISSILVFLDEQMAEQKASIGELRNYKKVARADESEYLDKLLLAARRNLSYLKKRRRTIANPDANRTATVGEIASCLHLHLRRYLPRDLNPQVLLRAAEHVADVIIVKRSRKAVSSRHDKAGGSREKTAKVRAEFATGTYTSKISCAMWAVKALGMTYGTALKALANQPNPSSKNKRLHV